MEETIKKLMLSGRVFRFNASSANQIYDLFADKRIKLESVSWGDEKKANNKELAPPDISNLEMWLTFKDCVDIELSYKDEKVLLTVYIWDGHPAHHPPRKGNRPLWEASFSEIPEFIIEMFKAEIHSVFRKKVEDIWESRQHKKKQEELKAIEKELLS